MQHFTDSLIEDYDNQLQNHWVNLSIEPWRFNYLVQNCWKTPPNNNENRALLSANEWQRKRELFLACGKNIQVADKAEICATSHKDGKKNYLVWLKFLDLSGNEHLIDFWINEFGKNTKNAEKCIDPRSPLCQDIYDAIVKNGRIPPEIAKLLPSIGSKTWTGSTESKVQKKLNSHTQQKIFEGAAETCNVKLTKLDPFDEHLYRGDPGRLADYDITIEGQTVRTDLKLLESNHTISQQKPHDAALLISSEWRTAEVAHHRVCGEASIETTPKFQELLDIFKKNLVAAGKCFIHINKIDLETGVVDYVLFGNNPQ